MVWEVVDGALGLSAPRREPISCFGIYIRKFTGRVTFHCFSMPNSSPRTCERALRLTCLCIIRTTDEEDALEN